MNKKNISIITIIILLALGLAGIFYFNSSPSYTPIPYEATGFANMRGADGVVYKGIGGAWGEDIPVTASTFAIDGDKIYFAEQIKEDYVVSDERFGALMSANLADGSNVKTLVTDAYNVGYGLEKLIGDKIFYTTGYDENYNLLYSYVDTNTLDTGKINSTRINNIFGYDGTCLLYTGYDDAKSQNIVGSYNLETGKDRTLYTFPNPGSIGSIIGISYSNGSIYSVAQIKKAENYDDRTAEYKIEVRNPLNGKVTSTLDFTLTGAANYGFLFDKDTLYYSTAESICSINLLDPSKKAVLSALKDLEYWGIPHFVPGDGYLYYEAIADIDFDTNLNDYFYRVSLTGGEPELLAAWLTN